MSLLAGRMTDGTEGASPGWRGTEVLLEHDLICPMGDRLTAPGQLCCSLVYFHLVCQKVPLKNSTTTALARVSEAVVKLVSKVSSDFRKRYSAGIEASNVVQVVFSG